METTRIQTFKPLSSKGWFGLLSLLLLTGCGGSSTAEQVCIPGVAQECPCGGVYQECKEDGSGFTSCPCNGIADAAESETDDTPSAAGDATASGLGRQEEAEGEALDAIIATPDSATGTSEASSAGEDGSDSAGDVTGNPEDAEEQEPDTADGAASGGEIGDTEGEKEDPDGSDGSGNEDGEDAVDEGDEEAASDVCPTAVITVQEGAQVIPQTPLHLVGDQSSSPLGEVTKWVWNVEQPEGSVATFSPSAQFPNPTFLANVAGSYLFSLEVEDASGTPNCEPAFAEVIVIPDEAVHVELLWTTPGDPDPADSGPQAGADLDLHFLHPYATPGQPDGTGSLGWFNTPFDCYWFNPAPNWGSANPDVLDNPQLDLDDTDGAGPENLNLALPENGMTYSIGAHYWADHGFGSSFATIRVYLFGTLVFEKAAVELENSDLWEACTLDWPEATVTPIGNGSQILPDYKDPYGFN